MEKEKFDQKKYTYNYRKNHYIEFRVFLKNEEMKKLNDLLKKNNMSKADFLRKAINELEKLNKL